MLRRRAPIAGPAGRGETPLDNSHATTAAELRQLVEDLLEVSADGRKLAADLSRSIREIVSVHCDSIDERARLILAKAEALTK